MSLVKSLSVGNGDMFYIRHNSDNFTIIDCCIYDSERSRIVQEIRSAMEGKEIRRFISTHPDEDHLRGLRALFSDIEIPNFYCVRNEATKEDESADFRAYRALRDRPDAFHLFAGCKRKWMNESDAERGSAGIHVYWPKVDNRHFKAALEECKAGNSPNNISPILAYLQDDIRIGWFGDLETDFMELISPDLALPHMTVIFAPHHGRDTGRLTPDILEMTEPKVIVVGEAPSEYLHYYPGYNTITQNRSGDIVIEVAHNWAHFYVESSVYEAPFLTNLELPDAHGAYYIGSQCA